VLHDPLQYVPYGARFDPLTYVILTVNFYLTVYNSYNCIVGLREVPMTLMLRAAVVLRCV